MDGETSLRGHPPKQEPYPASHSGTIADTLSSPDLVPEAAMDNEPLMRRKPLLPPRSSRLSLDKRSYNVIELQEMQNDGPSSVEEDTLAREFPLPKAFRKTHLLYGLDLGYWRMPARHFSIFSGLILLTLIPVYLISIHYNIESAVTGPFSYDCYKNSDGWSFVGVNLRFGSFSYGGAKAVDLAWNWVVGRGLQALFTWVAYRVFNDALLRVAEITPLSYELYATLSLYSTKPDILWQLLKGLVRGGNWRTRAIFIWLLISTIYLVIFPSLLDACSGYEVSYNALFRWPNGTLENLDDIYNNNGWQDNKTIMDSGSICATWTENVDNDGISNYTYYVLDSPSLRLISNTSTNKSTTNDCKVNYNSGDTHIYTEIQEVIYWTDGTLNNSWWKNFFDDPSASLLINYNSWRNWKFYPTLETSYRCSTEGDIYQWGFSYEWLFVVIIVNSVWLFGLWILWLDCDTNSELCRKGRRLGLWRAVADISEAMREELGPNICAYSEQELADALKKRPPIKYYTKPGTAQEPGHIGLSSRTSGRFTLKWNQEYGYSKDQ